MTTHNYFRGIFLSLMVLWTNIIFGQIVAWQFYGAPGGGRDLTYSATTNDINLETSVITRGAGTYATGGSTNSFNAEFKVSATRDAAVANNAYFEFKIKPKTGYFVSLTDIDCVIRIANVSSYTYQYAYSLDNVNFNFVGSPANATNTINNGTYVPTIDLASYTDLKNISSDQTLTMRLYAWNGVLTGTAVGYFGLGKSLTADVPALKIGGIVTNSVSTVSTNPKIVGWDFSSYNSTNLPTNSINATSKDVNLDTPVLSRGAGLTFATYNFAYTSTSSVSTTKESAVSKNEYYQLSVPPKVGYKLSLSTLKYTFRALAEGPLNYRWAYSIDNGASFTEIGSTNAVSLVSSGGIEYQFDLSGIEALQNVTATVLLRMYNWNATDNTSVFGFGRHLASSSTGAPINAVYLRGKVESLVNDNDESRISMGESVLGSTFTSNLQSNSKTSFEAKSTAFIIERDYINFQIKAAYNPFMLAINLWSDGKIIRSSTAKDITNWVNFTWDVSAYKGKSVYLQIVDADAEDNKTIEAGDFYQSNKPLTAASGNINDKINEAQEFALASVESNVTKAAQDPSRPVYHFHPLSQRMNDPNGTFYANGYYHLFYQYNPLADYSGGGYMLWGHARSKNLVDWEHLPIALWPNWSQGELHCYSGGALKKENQDVMLFYTCVPAPGLARTQWAAVNQDADYLNWTRYTDYPVINYYPTGSPDPGLSWRDPFIFEDGGSVFALLTTSNGVALYKSNNIELTDWIYKGIIYNPAGAAECPNFFRIRDNKWILLVSPQNPVEYQVGTFDPVNASFTAESTGTLNSNAQYYATQGLKDDQGRLILFGLIKGFKNNMGWRDCLALPRVLSLGDDGKPRQVPVPELSVLRKNEITVSNIIVNSTRQVINEISGDVMELFTEFEPVDATSFGIRVRCSAAGDRSFEIRYENNQLVLPNSKVASVSIPPVDGKVKLRIFIDKGAIEVFSEDGKVAETRVYYATEGDNNVELFATNGTVKLNKLQAWTLDPSKIATKTAQQNPGKPSLHINSTGKLLYLKSDKFINTIAIIDSCGRNIFLKKSLNQNEIEIPIDKLGNGIYIIKINNAFTEKFIKG